MNCLEKLEFHPKYEGEYYDCTSITSWKYAEFVVEDEDTNEAIIIDPSWN